MVRVIPNYKFLWLLVVVKYTLAKNGWFVVWVMLEVSLEIGAFAKLRTDLGLAGSPKKIWGK